MSVDDTTSATSARLDETLHQDRILILDFGSQVTQLIARRVRESGVYCEIWPFTVDPARIVAFAPRGIILSGGPASAIQADAPRVPDVVFEMAIPVLGICYGQQAMCLQLGGKVESSDHREFGRAFVDIVEDCSLFRGAWARGGREQVWMSHGDRVTSLPPGFRTVATSEGAPFAVIADEGRHLYGVQFHPEVVHTLHGAALLRNFTHNVAGCSGTWTMAGFREMEIARIREQVGTGKVICGLSGGVDSSVAAVLIQQAIGDQLTCIFVDHGMLRAGEAEEVMETFRGRFNINLVHRDASDIFLKALDGVTDPEVKRKTIGRLFVEVFEEEASRLGGAQFLAQGTLYPDVIESVSFTGGPSVTIKSHHNVGGLPERMNMKLVEPLRELFKDEVRALGRELNIPEVIVGRHPFPGPGLSIRIPGAITREKLDLLRRVDTVFLEEIRAAGLYDAIWQAFAVLLPVRTVGVMGDGRTYDQACALRAVTSTDGMTAEVYPFDMGFLNRVASRIVNEVRGINRVTYDITSKPPGTIEWE
ncbi:MULTISPECIES: glutamine-hydrolyzing GMP synthase [Acetobacter]|uniref:GMP synthase [glutamine-hydrolyzing] n=1 Tax=Acetobacter thailandicus TaxID=1502842 RepID=A0ABT3QH32_9PROT|nr:MULTISPECIES: glutamine-hydrolyzing GMP synthase [Acetobacter]MBS0981514.1 glutamine-hydrolyzing GMP synthase [Acetobacter thailandicus]MBS0986305.1 glutamine-hydrolyzing GMP synthase [Acetobacter thailandicus]MBS1003088.1 glutamine-hydrolyzing GMP synthase [Acetobacter thailandicus]MCX2564603.1 glutamine-hydrolyzing GMP synthase [Acetobacter thailandicus]NHN95931.1 glutamine-hydrolyzing GMP synthase [Acetobacter thailandicus]